MSQIYNLKIAIHNCVEHRSAAHNPESEIFKFPQHPNSELWNSVARIHDDFSLAIGRTRPGLDLLAEEERKEADLKSVYPVVEMRELRPRKRQNPSMKLVSTGFSEYRMTYFDKFKGMLIHTYLDIKV